jgi:hypothetical protein
MTLPIGSCHASLATPYTFRVPAAPQHRSPLVRRCRGSLQPSFALGLRHVAGVLYARSLSKALQERDQVALLFRGQCLGRAEITISVRLLLAGEGERWKSSEKVVAVEIDDDF